MEDEEFVCIRWRKEPLKGSVVESVFWLSKSTVYQEAVIGTINAMPFSVIECHEIKQVTSLRCEGIEG